MSGELLSSAVAVLIAAGAGALLVGRLGRESKPLMAHRSEAIAQFETWLESGAAAQLGLSPKGVEVVQESETVGDSEGGTIYSYTLTRFLRCSDGRYVMFKSTPQRPYVKLVAPAVAKAVLKERYVPKLDS